MSGVHDKLISIKSRRKKKTERENIRNKIATHEICIIEKSSSCFNAHEMRAERRRPSRGKTEKELLHVILIMENFGFYYVKTLRWDGGGRWKKSKAKHFLEWKARGERAGGFGELQPVELSCFTCNFDIDF